MDKKIKLLLLLLNKKNINVNLETKMRYSKEYDNIYTNYKLVFWYKGQKDDKEYWYSKSQEFSNKINLLKYLIQVKDDINE